MNGKFWGNIVFAAVLVCLVAFAVTKISASSGIEDLFLPEVKVSDSAVELLHSVKLVRSAVKVRETGHIVDASFAIENQGGHAIKNISILCTLFNDAGQEQGRNKWTIFDTVESKGRGMFTFCDKKFISDSVVRSECQIVDLDAVKAPLFTVHRGSAGHNDSAADSHGGGAQQAAGHGSTH
jgi:hypothetical protein